MGTVVISTASKAQNEDMQGQVAASELSRLGFDQFTDVRVGKRYVLRVEGPVTDEVLAAARQAAEKVLVDPAEEDVVSVTCTDGDENEASAPWEDFGSAWGGDDAVANATAGHRAKAAAAPRQIRERHLGDVESASIAAYDADDE